MQNICLGVEISPDGLKVALVELERKNVIKIDVIPTSGNSINDTSIYASVASSWVRRNLLPKISSVAVAFSVHDGIIRLIDIPKECEGALNYNKQNENARSYAKWEFSSATEYRESDYLLDIVFSPNEKKPNRAFVTALRKTVVDSFCSAELEKSGFSPNCLMADVTALFNVLSYSEGFGSQLKCVLKADEKFVIAFWGNETLPVAIRALPKDCISVGGVATLLENGYKEFPKAKRIVKFCGELSADSTFATELAVAAKELKQPIDVQIWNTLSKFSFEKNGDFSKLSQCFGAIGAAMGCA
jgi:hypothetical protein